MTDAVLHRFRAADANWLIASHGRLYAEEAGFDASFERLVAEIVTDFTKKHDPGAERGWIAWKGEARMGAIFCVRADESTARLRLFLVEPRARGTGLGRQLLETCLAFARAQGYARLVLSTHESHRAACALYRKRGFTLKSARPVRSFGQDLVEQNWEFVF